MKFDILTKKNPASDHEAEENWMRPSYDVNETEDTFQITARVPGVAKDGLELIVDDDNLVITARKTWKKPEGWLPVAQEITTNNYRLVLELDHRVNADAIKAELTQGVLTVTLPKSEASKPRKIEIQG